MASRDGENGAFVMLPVALLHVEDKLKLCVCANILPAVGVFRWCRRACEADIQ